MTGPQDNNIFLLLTYGSFFGLVGGFYFLVALPYQKLFNTKLPVIIGSSSLITDDTHVAGVLTVLELIVMLRATFSDPGVIPRGDLPEPVEEVKDSPGRKEENSEMLVTSEGPPAAEPDHKYSALTIEKEAESKQKDYRNFELAFHRYFSCNILDWLAQDIAQNARR
jgi:hypothetical protein